MSNTSATSTTSAGTVPATPRGLAGEQIHIAGRIVGLRDALDALVSLRCYKEARDFDKALAYIGEQASRQFDPKMVRLLLKRLAPVRAIYENYPDQSSTRFTRRP